MAFIRIVILCILAAVTFGIAHDHVTTRISVEYFTIGHPQIIASTSPTALAFAWGVVATWWMGVFPGIPLAVCCRAGRRPKLAAGDILPGVVILPIVMAVLAACAAVIGRLLTMNGQVWLDGWLANEVPADRHIDFLTALWAHTGSYASGPIGGICLCILAMRRRRKLGGNLV